MPRFTVLRTVDAFLRYTAEVEADDALQAARKAYSHEDAYPWTFEGTDISDAHSFQTLDDNGLPMKSAKVGDF